MRSGLLKILKPRAAETGIALLEFVIIVPILILWGFSLFEVGMAFSDQQRVATATREVGQAIYTACKDNPDLNDMKDCVENSDVKSDITKLVSQFLPGYPGNVRVFLTLFAPQDVGGVITVKKIGGSSLGTFSKSSKKKETDADVIQLANDLGKTFVIEIYYKRINYTPLNKLIKVMFPTEVYKVALR